MHPIDNVATAVEAIASGETVTMPLRGSTISLIAAEPIAFGFKIALRDIAQGEVISKYGEAIGTASKPIAKGQMVHVHNLDGTRARGDLTRTPRS